MLTRPAHEHDRENQNERQTPHDKKQFITSSRALSQYGTLEKPLNSDPTSPPSDADRFEEGMGKGTKESSRDPKI